MQYKLIGSNDVNDIVSTILINRGIEEPHKYLYITEDCVPDWHDLENIDDAVECFVQHFERGDDIAVLIDGDP